MAQEDLKAGDTVLYHGGLYYVVWIDDSGATGLVGLLGMEGETKVVSQQESLLRKSAEE